MFDLFDQNGERVGTAGLRHGKIWVRAGDRRWKARLVAFFNAPETLWERGQPRTELAGSLAHLEGRCRALYRLGLSSEPACAAQAPRAA